MFLERYLENASDAIFDLGKVSSTYERTRAMVQRNRLSAMQDVENRKRVQGLPQVLYVALLVLVRGLLYCCFVVLRSFLVFHSICSHHIVAQHITEEDIQALKQQFPDPNRLELLLTACQVEQ